ncbi:glycosyl hydrolase family 28-related protein [Streptomyces sp. NPDC051940]|uniref:glycosyl hydrolase family 28-related protein n=1 Tax=Streptomyces sp. NPDC051940 TaxID=3155675 RepID=UPI00344688AB
MDSTPSGISRRRLLGNAAGLAAGSAVLGGASPARADAAQTPDLWREFAATPYTHPQIPYVARAGCDYGATPFPSPPVRANVQRYGAVPDGSADAAPAINAAIREVGEAGGGTVVIPAGRYRCDDIIQIGWSNVVVRGDGIGETTLYFTRSLEQIVGINRSRFGGSNSAWSWCGGLVWIAPRARFTSLVEAIQAQDWPLEGWSGNRREQCETLTALAAPARQGDWTVTVADPGALAPGDRVMLQLDDTPDHALLAHMCGDIAGTSSYYWENKTKLLSYPPYEWPVRVTAVDGDRVTLDRPLPLDARPEFAPRLTTLVPPVTGSGLESLTVEMTETPQLRHLQDKGYNGVVLQCAWDCWVDQVRTVHVDNGFLFVAAKACTLRRTSVGGRGSHHPYACREQSHDNLVEDFRIEDRTAPAVPGSGLHGINVEGLSSHNVWSRGVMEMATFDTHRGLPFANVRTDITVNNTGAHGGSDDAGPLYGARFAHWNVTVTNERAGCVRIDDVAPRSATVAITPVRPFGQIDRPDFTGDLDTRLELYGTTRVTPRNLYDAQRTLGV